MPKLTPEDSETIRDLRRRGFAVVVFNPEELGEASRDRVESRLCELGWDVIDSLSGPSASEDDAD